jgi:glycerol-3-phosphate dehydrogenase
MKNRAEALRAIESQTFDVCVIGAGATGAGCALDAQLRGLRTVLIDRGDFASGSSSASTKLAHGGVRYLQQAIQKFDLGQLKVVREALRERISLIENAPYLAHECEFLVPCFSRYEIFYYGSGMKLYEWFAGKASLGPSGILSPEHALASLPTLKREHLLGAVSYLDGQFDDARYGLILVKSFANSGGEVANYLGVVNFEKSAGGRLGTAAVQDSLSGHSLRVHAKVFVNATGPFSDGIRLLANPKLASRLVPSKGSHILLPLPAGVSKALLIPETEDGRVIFAIPWLGRLLVGTTDEEVTLDQELVVTRSEAEYLLRHFNRYSERTYVLGDIVAAFAGIRPLVRAKQARQTKNLIRDHEVEVDADSGLISILGGKWTTYRVMAEDTITAVQKQLKHSIPASATRAFPLAGAVGYSSNHWKELTTEYDLTEATARHLSEKFGMEAAAVLAIAREREEYSRPLAADAPALQAEAVYCARHEMAMSIEDILARRIGLQNFSWNSAVEAAPDVARILSRELGWNEQQTQEAVEAYVEKFRRWQSIIGIQQA